jgi:pyruvate/2-oxoglutarate dehydrogenase complex dihydrolipoamide acyltransferase (E2) component
MERTVKYLQVGWFHPAEDPITGEPRNVAREAAYGVTLHTEDGTDDDKNIYGVPEKELLRVERANPGCFFLEGEEPGGRVVDEFPDQDIVVGRDTVTGTDDGRADFDPIATEDLAQWQIAEWIARDKPTPEAMFKAVNAVDDPVKKEKLLRNMLAAEVEVTKDEPRDEVVIGLTGLLSAMGVDATAPAMPGFTSAVSGDAPPVPPGPEGPPPGTPATDDTGGSPGTGGEVSPTDPGAIDSAGNPLPATEPVVVEATESAKRLAAELGLDINQIKGTGSGGRVIEPDVKAYHKEQNEATGS